MNNLLKLDNRPCIEEILAHPFVDAKLVKLYREGKERLNKSENVYVAELCDLIELHEDEGPEEVRPLTSEE